MSKSSTLLTAVSHTPHYFDVRMSNVLLSDYPAYELYTDVLRNGIFGDERRKQLCFVVGKDRKVKEVHHI